MRQLTRRGTPAVEAEDIVQEVAVRALVSKPCFTDAPDLLRWASTVARRVAINQHRADQRFASQPFDEGDGRARTVVGTVEDRVVQRLFAADVLAAARHLTACERAALFASAATEADRHAQIRVAVRRYRARARLARLVGGIGAVVAGWLRVRPRRAAAASTATLGIVALVVATGLLSEDVHRAPDPETLARRDSPAADFRSPPRAAGSAPHASPRPRVDSSVPRAPRFSNHTAVPPPVGGWNPGHVSVINRPPSEQALVCAHVPGLTTFCVR